MFDEKFLNIQRKWAVNERPKPDKIESETSLKFGKNANSDLSVSNIGVTGGEDEDTSGFSDAGFFDHKVPKNKSGEIEDSSITVIDMMNEKQIKIENNSLNGFQENSERNVSENRKNDGMKDSNGFSGDLNSNSGELNFQNQNNCDNKYEENSNYTDDNSEVINERFKVKKIYHKTGNNYLKIALFIFIPVAIGIFFALFANSESGAESIWNDAIEMHNQKKYVQAIEFYLKYFEKAEYKEEKIKGLYYTGVCNLAMKDYTTASQFFKKTLDYYETNADGFYQASGYKDLYSGLAHYWLGKILLEQKMYLEAVEEFNNVVLKYPDNPVYSKAYLNILLSNVEMGKWERVVELGKTLLTLKESNIDGGVYYYLAVAYENMNLFDLAEKYYRILIENNNFDSKYSLSAKKKIYNYAPIIRETGNLINE
ncbi:MAG TPA: tetratricopeptide repeat protein [bacterium]|nr:tetratricopeptide repeat protein [bacterium]HPN30448.1 tetratricopeptide repeat protein [bacterium]